MTVNAETDRKNGAEIARRLNLVREQELEAKKIAEDLTKERAALERELLDYFAETETDGLVVDGRQVYIRPITTAKLKEGVDIRSKEFRAALEEYDLDHLLDPKITSTALASAIRKLSDMFDGKIPDDAKILDFVDLGAVYALGNKKA